MLSVCGLNHASISSRFPTSRGHIFQLHQLLRSLVMHDLRRFGWGEAGGAAHPATALTRTHEYPESNPCLRIWVYFLRQ